MTPFHGVHREALPRRRRGAAVAPTGGVVGAQAGVRSGVRSGVPSRSD
ncbi:hypothetical protein ACIHAA_30570 [Streptomyces sp. NPDC052040]